MLLLGYERMNMQVIISVALGWLLQRDYNSLFDYIISISKVYQKNGMQIAYPKYDTIGAEFTQQPAQGGMVFFGIRVAGEDNVLEPMLPNAVEDVATRQVRTVKKVTDVWLEAFRGTFG